LRWGEVVERGVRSLFVVADHPLPREIADGFEVIRQVSIEDIQMRKNGRCGP